MAIDTLAHGVLSDLLSATGNNMDITLLAPNMESSTESTESTQVFATSRHFQGSCKTTWASSRFPHSRFVAICAVVQRMVTLLFGSGCFRSPLVSLDQMIER